MTISQYYQNASNVELDSLFVEVVSETEKVLLEMNKKQLFEKSEDSEKRPLSPYSSLTYASEKNKMNSLPGFGSPDLFYTGAFYSRFFLDVDKEGFGIYSGDDKTSDLVDRYGISIFGVNKDNLAIYVQTFFREAFISKIYANLAK